MREGGGGKKGDAQRAPVARDALAVGGDAGGAGVRGPAGRALVVKGDVDVRVVLELVELVRGAVREEDERDLRRGRRCGVAERWQGVRGKWKEGRRGLDSRATGAMAREWSAPEAERVVSMPVLTVLTMSCRAAIFSCGERLSFSALAVYGSSSAVAFAVVLVDMVSLGASVSAVFSTLGVWVRVTVRGDALLCAASVYMGRGSTSGSD